MGHQKRFNKNRNCVPLLCRDVFLSSGGSSNHPHAFIIFVHFCFFNFINEMLEGATKEEIARNLKYIILLMV